MPKMRRGGERVRRLETEEILGFEPCWSNPRSKIEGLFAAL